MQMWGQLKGCFRHSKLTLAEFRQRLVRARNRKEAAVIEAELEVLLDSQPYYRGATRRSIRAGMQEAMSGLERLLDLAKKCNEMRRRGGPTSTADTYAQRLKASRNKPRL
jgi:hypothetical protein